LGGEALGWEGGEFDKEKKGWRADAATLPLGWRIGRESDMDKEHVGVCESSTQVKRVGKDRAAGEHGSFAECPINLNRKLHNNRLVGSVRLADEDVGGGEGTAR